MNYTTTARPVRTQEDVIADNLAAIQDICNNVRLSNKNKQAAIDAILCGEDVSYKVRCAVSRFINARQLFLNELNFLSES